LQAGVDRSVIALWLGHESVETTQTHLLHSAAQSARNPLIRHGSTLPNAKV
jgi:integrase